MNLLLDMDGILVDLQYGLLSYHKRLDIYNNYPIGIYDLCKVLNITQNELFVCDSIDFWANLPKTPDFDEIINICTFYFTLDQIFIVTKPTNSTYSINGKIAWMEKYLPYLRKNLVFTSHKYLLVGHKDNLLVDDYDKNVESFIQNGGEAFLYPRPWNRKYKSIQNSIKLLQEAIHSFTIVG